MRKILISILTIAVVSAGVYGFTQAFFSDTEVSSDNTFTAGSLDLKIKNQYSVSTGVENDGATNWDFDDVDGKFYFKFSDIKPGDWGENTISYKVVDNDAWMCSKIITTDEENGRTEPEITAADPDDLNGELGNYLSFIWWVDDGDNKLNGDETPLFGPSITLNNLLDFSDGDLTIADKEHNMNGNDGTPVPGNIEQHLGIGWCLGAISIDSQAPNGFTCDGSGVSNIVQSDKVIGSLSFTAEQYRNNPDYLCPEHL